MLRGIIMSNNCTKFLAGMGKDIVQYFVKTITHCLKYCCFNVYMFCQNIHNPLIYIVDILFVEDIYCKIFICRDKIILYECR